MRCQLGFAVCLMCLMAGSAEAAKPAYSGTITVSGKSHTLVVTAAQANKLYTGKGGDIAAASLQEAEANESGTREHAVYLLLTIQRPRGFDPGAETVGYKCSPPIGGTLTLTRIPAPNGFVGQLAWPDTITMTPGTAP